MVSGYPDWHKGVKADIIAQTLEKIAVDIVSATVGNLGVDIKAQTINKLDIDIVAQSVAELHTFWKIGKTYAQRAGWNADANKSVTILSVTGKGILFFYLVRVYANTNSNNVGIEIIADGCNVEGYTTFDLWHDYGCTAETAPFALTKYGVDDECVGMFVPRIPLTFESSLELKVSNPTSYSQSGDYWYVYTLL